MNERDGGSAFPRERYAQGSDDHGSREGMSLRDYFAAQAIAALGAEDIMGILIDREKEHPELEVVTAAAQFAYDIAEAMLKERALR